MTSQGLVTLATSLFERTHDGAVAWEAAAEQGVFQVALSSYTVRVFQRSAGPGPDAAAGGPIALEIRDQEDHLVEQVDTASRHEGIGEILPFIFHEARGRARHVDKAIGEILAELQAL